MDVKKAKFSKLQALVMIVLLGIMIFVLAHIPSSHYNAALRVVFVAVLVCCFWILSKRINICWVGRRNRVAHRERLSWMFLSMMLTSWVAGVGLYMVAYIVAYGQFEITWVEVFSRSIVCSLNLFLLDVDPSFMDTVAKSIEDTKVSTEYLRTFIMVQGVVSFSCTILLLVNFVIDRALAVYRLRYKTKVNAACNHLYIFFGENEPAILLAQSVRENDAKALILFVESDNIDDGKPSRGLDSILGFFTHKKQIYTNVDKLGARLMFCGGALCNADPVQFHNNDVLAAMNLGRLRTLLKKLYQTSSSADKAVLNIFFMSQQEEENLRAINVLSADCTICEGKDIVKMQFFCHARRNLVNKVIEDIAVKRGIEVSVVDSSHLAIETLKMNPDYHPVNLVEVNKENPTTVNSPFTSLVVGFDEAGRDAVRFLYEYAAFVDSSATPDNENRSPFCCYAIDSKMDQLRGVFESFTPAMKNNPMIHLSQCDCHSQEFYTQVLTDHFCENVNYIVIVVGDDELGMSFAIRILTYIRTRREDLSKLRIFVRSYQSDKYPFMQKLADHYNNGYNNDCEKKEYVNKLGLIIPFGRPEKIYSYSMIVDETLERQGKIFMENYSRLRNESDIWEHRRDLAVGVKKVVKDELGIKNYVNVPLEQRSPSLNKLMSLRRKESQDISNAQHAATKLNLLQRCMPDDYDWEYFMHRYFNPDGTPDCVGKFDKITYPNLTEYENRAILNLARLEHLRWNASHEVLGYSKANPQLHGCDERTKQHNCLRPWQELDDECKEVAKAEKWTPDYKKYDFGVVDVSLSLNKDKLLIKSSDF